MEKNLTRQDETKAIGCPVETTINAIGGRWKVLIIHFLMDRPHRFGELTKALGGIPARTLTRQLRELEESGVISRKDYHQVPPRVDYSLTPLGLKLKPILLAMHTWGLEAEKSSGRRSQKQSS